VTTARLRLAATAAIATLAAFWFYLSSASVSSSVEDRSFSTAVLVVVGLAAAVNLVALVLAAVAVFYLPRGKPAYFWFVVVVLAANSVASLADQFGIVDVVYIVACLVALGLTIGLRRRLPRRPRAEPGR
jgi:hypothetical protein